MERNIQYRTLKQRSLSTPLRMDRYVGPGGDASIYLSICLRQISVDNRSREVSATSRSSTESSVCIRHQDNRVDGEEDSTTYTHEQLPLPASRDRTRLYTRSLQAAPQDPPDEQDRDTDDGSPEKR